MLKKVLFSILMVSGICNCSETILPSQMTLQWLHNQYAQNAQTKNLSKSEYSETRPPHTPPSVLSELRNLSEPKTPTQQTQSFQTITGVCPSQKHAYFEAKKRQRNQ